MYSSSSTYKVHCTSTTHDPLSNEEVCEKQAHKVQHASVLKSPVLGTVCRSTGVRWSEAELGRGNISLGRMAAALCKPHISRAEAARRPTGAENAGKATSQQLPGFHLVASVYSLVTSSLARLAISISWRLNSTYKPKGFLWQRHVEPQQWSKLVWFCGAKQYKHRPSSELLEKEFKTSLKWEQYEVAAKQIKWCDLGLSSIKPRRVEDGILDPSSWSPALIFADTVEDQDDKTLVELEQWTKWKGLTIFNSFHFKNAIKSVDKVLEGGATQLRI